MNKYLTIGKSLDFKDLLVLINNYRADIVSFSKTNDNIVISKERNCGITVTMTKEKAVEILKDIIEWIESE